MPQRLTAMPDAGRVVVAAPASLWMARYAAFELGLPFLLDPAVPAGQVHVLTVERCWQLEDEWLRGAASETRRV